nr:hypothetical protein CFP56_69529 [Quercus suber]
MASFVLSHPPIYMHTQSPPSLIITNETHSLVAMFVVPLPKVFRKSWSTLGPDPPARGKSNGVSRLQQQQQPPLEPVTCATDEQFEILVLRDEVSRTDSFRVWSLGRDWS